MAAASNMRVKVLRKKMEDLQKKRIIMFSKPKTLAGNVDLVEADHNNNPRKKQFMLDKISDLGSKSKQEKDAEVKIILIKADNCVPLLVS